MPRRRAHWLASRTTRFSDPAAVSTCQLGPVLGAGGAGAAAGAGAAVGAGAGAAATAVGGAGADETGAGNPTVSLAGAPELGVTAALVPPPASAFDAAPTGAPVGSPGVATTGPAAAPVAGACGGGAAPAGVDGVVAADSRAIRPADRRCADGESGHDRERRRDARARHHDPGGERRVPALAWLGAVRRLSHRRALPHTARSRACFSASDIPSSLPWQSRAGTGGATTGIVGVVVGGGADAAWSSGAGAEPLFAAVAGNGARDRCRTGCAPGRLAREAPRRCAGGRLGRRARDLPGRRCRKQRLLATVGGLLIDQPRRPG